MLNSRIKMATMTGATILFPLTAFAADKKLSDIINTIVSYLGDILFLLMALAVVIFVWYVIKYFIMPNESRKEAGQYVMYSLIGFFVILSMWGIVSVISNTLDIGGAGPQTWDNFRNIFPR